MLLSEHVGHPRSQPQKHNITLQTIQEMVKIYSVQNRLYLVIYWNDLNMAVTGYPEDRINSRLN